MKRNTSIKKRLFLFAGYNANNIIDASLVYYVSCLAQVGDVVLCMDSDIPKSELKKIEPFTLKAMAERHREYDFGSYKRAYLWAKENLDLNKYDFVYMLNDSVYGPLFNIKPYLDKMESFGTDAFGLIENPKKEHPHIQSWFIGMCKTVFLSDWFDKFITGVTHQNGKGMITRIYEHGFSKLVIEHGETWKCIYSIYGRGVYNRVRKMYRMKIPFFKKVSFTRHDGGLGPQIHYVLNHILPKTRDAIVTSAQDAYGHEYIKTMLSRGYLSGTLHTLKYGIKKFLAGKL